MKKIITFFTFILFAFQFANAQEFTQADTLRGSNGPGRFWWNATQYDLHVSFNLSDSSISGYNIISYKIIDKKHPDFFQIDLQEPMIIDSVINVTGNKNFALNREKLSFTKEGNAWFVYLKNSALRPTTKHDINTIMLTSKSKESASEPSSAEVTSLYVYYHGQPRKAKNAPWDGGFVWKRDKRDNPWVAVACQGLGASVWYPCKDWQGDEPDSAEMHFTVPDSLMAISNGRLRNKISNNDSTVTYNWAVESPINNYDITFYIGKFDHFGEIYKREKGDLTLDYWVLDSNLQKAKTQFKDVPRMLKAFEFWFGPYPFYKDGYKLVDAPYLGMEHQSAIAYGNHYKMGYLGRDLSGTGWGLKWDFIIVHESAHEWWGNNITAKDIADMWIHESFANYAEALFTEFYYGKKAADEYVIGVRKNIRNDKDIQGPFGVNEEGSGDMYYKGGNMLHMIRQIINNDKKFRDILRGLNSTFYHQTVTGKQVEDYINNHSGVNFSKVFDQYLRTTQIPVLEYKKVKGVLYFRWTNCVDHFNMPLKIYNDQDKLIFVHPTPIFQKAPKGVTQVKVDENFYVETQQAP